MAPCCVVGDEKQLSIPHPTFPCVHKKRKPVQPAENTYLVDSGMCGQTEGPLELTP